MAASYPSALGIFDTRVKAVQCAQGTIVRLTGNTKGVSFLGVPMFSCGRQKSRGQGSSWTAG